jgi:hypothetical protein
MFTTLSKQFLPHLFKILAKSIFIWKNFNTCLVLNGMRRNCLLGLGEHKKKNSQAYLAWTNTKHILGFGK